MIKNGRTMRTRYYSALEDFLSRRGERPLKEAYEIGRRTLASGEGLFGIVSAHRAALGKALAETRAPGQTAERALAATDFLIESLSPFEMTQRGLKEAYTALAAKIELLLKNEAKIEELNRRLSNTIKDLEHSNRELEAFAYSVSHDLRAPLRAIDGFTEILLDDYGERLDAEGRRVCAVIRENAQRMGALIDDLLAFSRLGRASLTRVPIDMGREAEGAFLEVATPEDRQRVDFKIRALPAAAGDPVMLRQVWVNLISNAVKFSSRRERPVVAVDGEERGGEAVYSVRDNGAGFDMRHADKLFGVFQRLHGRKEFEGTGVGLAIVKRVVERHGGRVWAEGAPDEGASFFFSLPRGAGTGEGGNDG
jgi:light-regulated signal transduction histidine kinase (bacteriophytochrome)